MPDYATLPFDEAIAYLRQKISLPTERWDDILDAEHDAAFVIAGAKGSILTELREAVTRAIADGKRPAEFRADFERISQSWAHRGGKDWRARIILETNMRRAYAAGRYTYQLDPETLKFQPYLQWVHGDSRRDRPTHKALDGKVFRAQELPFYPPHGFGCRCRTISLTERQVQERGLTVESLKLGDFVRYKDPRSGKETRIRLEAERGFDGIPGQSRPEQRAQMMQQILRRLDPVDVAWVRQEMAAIDQRIARKRLEEG